MSGLFKKVIFLLLLFAFACSNNQVEDKKITIAVSIAPYKYLVKKIGGDRVDVINSIPVGATPHHFEPTPKLIQSISKADYYFAVGKNMEFEETWLSKLKGVNNNLSVYDLSQNVVYVNNDPHVWLGFSQLKTVTQNVYNSLSEILGEDKNYFTSNFEALIDSINLVEKELRSSFEKVGNKKLLVYHGSWTYFADEFGFEQISIEQGSKSSSAKEFKTILNEVKGNNVPVIFVDPQHSKESAKVIAKDLQINLETINPIPSSLLINFINVKNKIIKYYQ